MSIRPKRPSPPRPQAQPKKNPTKAPAAPQAIPPPPPMSPAPTSAIPAGIPLPFGDDPTPPDFTLPAQALPPVLPAINIQIMSSPPTSTDPLPSYTERHPLASASDNDPIPPDINWGITAPKPTPVGEQRERVTLADAFGMTAYARIALAQFALSDPAKSELRRTGGWETINLGNFNFIPIFSAVENLIWNTFHDATDLRETCVALGANWFRQRGIPLPSFIFLHG